ncbi:SCP2 sterol-binding domain-containing protein [uncultured Ferrimonas sp.]|uniref:ubiquinone biosynthesis accessory factor UbiJ n=1 Tax=uncultured Ferrimonas sp. TaxID=432640 RepID=UPI00262EC70B|nr:SCP2 sterol-binding domain-containing protein [uncultured Ferrimonas sp.]
MQLSTLLAGAVETALARLLKQHPHSAPLAQWQGQVVRVQLHPLPFPLYLIMTDPIQVYSQYDGDCACSLALSVSTLAKLKDNANLTELSRSGELQLDGDIKLAGQLAALLGAIEPDLAEPLAKLVGGAMAHRIDTLGRSILHRASADLSRLSRHSAVFVRDELQLAPSQTELNEFVADVDQLAERVQRIQQRLEQHESSL